MKTFFIKEDINENVTREFSFVPMIKLIYPDKRSAYIFLDLDNIPKEKERFNNVYKYNQIIINGIDENGIIDGYIELDYGLPQLEYKND